MRDELLDPGPIDDDDEAFGTGDRMPTGVPADLGDEGVYGLGVLGGARLDDTLGQEVDLCEEVGAGVDGGGAPRRARTPDPGDQVEACDSAHALGGDVTRLAQRLLIDVDGGRGGGQGLLVTGGLVLRHCGCPSR